MRLEHEEPQNKNPIETLCLHSHNSQRKRNGPRIPSWPPPPLALAQSPPSPSPSSSSSAPSRRAAADSPTTTSAMQTDSSSTRLLGCHCHYPATRFRLRLLLLLRHVTRLSLGRAGSVAAGTAPARGSAQGAPRQLEMGRTSHGANKSTTNFLGAPSPRLPTRCVRTQCSLAPAHYLRHITCDSSLSDHSLDGFSQIFTLKLSREKMATTHLTKQSWRACVRRHPHGGALVQLPQPRKRRPAPLEHVRLFTSQQMGKHRRRRRKWWPVGGTNKRPHVQ